MRVGAAACGGRDSGACAVGPDGKGPRRRRGGNMRTEQGGDGPPGSSAGRRDASSRPADEDSAILAAALEVLEHAYQAFLNPHEFARLLEVWGGHVLALGPERAARLNARLERHLERALPVLEVNAERQLQGDVLGRAVSEQLRPAVAVSPSGLVIAANEAAERRLGLSEGDQLGEAHFAPGDWEAARAFMRAPPAADPSRRLTVRLMTPEGEPAPADLAMMPARAGQAPALLLRSFEMTLSPEARAVLTARFRLTEAETEVMQNLLGGRDAADIARARRTSVATVRTQIRSIREKTGARSQLDLVRLAASLCALDETRRAELATVAARMRRSYRPPARHELATLPDGRQVEHRRIGPPNGAPTLMLHGSLFGFALPDAFFETLTAAGRSLWIPARPGFGASSPLPDDAGLADEAQALLRYADHAGLGRFAVIAHGAAAPLGAALAQAAPERLESLALISGFLPDRPNAADADTPPWQALVQIMARGTPRLLQLLCRAGAQMLRQIGARDFYRHAYSSAPADRAAVESGATLALMKVSFNMVLAQDLRGFAQDFKLAAEDWSALWRRTALPVALIHGDQPQAYDLALARRAAALAPNACVRPIEGAGQLAALTHPMPVAHETLRHLRAHARAPQ